MKKLLIFLAIIIAIVIRAAMIEHNYPEQWPTVWKNFKDTESVTNLLTETVAVFRGERVKRVAMSIREMNTIVYRWKDERGEVHLSYQKPTGVDNVEEIRLGDLNYQIESSLSEEEKALLLKKKD